MVVQIIMKVTTFTLTCDYAVNPCCFLGSASVFRRRWIEPHSCWYNDKLASQFEAVLVIRDAFNSLISSDKPGSYDVTVACSSPLFELLQVSPRVLVICVYIF